VMALRGGRVIRGVCELWGEAVDEEL